MIISLYKTIISKLSNKQVVEHKNCKLFAIIIHQVYNILMLKSVGVFAIVSLLLKKCGCFDTHNTHVRYALGFIVYIVLEFLQVCSSR